MHLAVSARSKKILRNTFHKVLIHALYVKECAGVFSGLYSDLYCFDVLDFGNFVCDELYS